MQSILPHTHDPKRVMSAYDFAATAHAGQKRGTGEDYIIHPLAVATITCEWGVDDDIIIAALLHDVVEDTPVTLKEIHDLFGARVADLVDGVTKITQLRREVRQTTDPKSATMRKIILGMSLDLGVILIKLGDRLHNMRTLYGLSRERQIKIATETMQIYAPIAHRLGMHLLQSELEDLCFAILQPEEYERIRLILEEAAPASEKRLEEVGNQLVSLLQQNNIEAVITGRIKHAYSVWRKMQRIEDLPHDLIGLRVIVPERVRDCYLVLGLVHSLWDPIPGAFDDYIAQPKINGYRSLHTTVRADERPLEVQIRTQAMQRDAEYGVAAHYTYKEDLPALDDPSRKSAEAALSYRRQWVDNLPQEQSASFLEDLLEYLHTDDIHVVTPQGQVVPLPVGATAIDFGYAIHSDLGDKIAAAKINGFISPLGRKLRNGDQVEIIIGGRPHEDWLSMAVSARARAAIRRYLQKEANSQAAEKGKASLVKEAKKLEVEDLLKSAILPPVAKDLGYERSDDLYIALGERKIKTGTVIRRLLEASEQNITGLRTVFYLQGWDRQGILSDVGDIISQAGGNIMSHHGWTTNDGFILELTVLFSANYIPPEILAHLRSIHGVWDAWSNEL